MKFDILIHFYTKNNAIRNGLNRLIIASATHVTLYFEKFVTYVKEIFQNKNEFESIQRDRQLRYE